MSDPFRLAGSLRRLAGRCFHPAACLGFSRCSCFGAPADLREGLAPRVTAVYDPTALIRRLQVEVGKAAGPRTREALPLPLPPSPIFVALNRRPRWC